MQHDLLVALRDALDLAIDKSEENALDAIPPRERVS